MRLCASGSAAPQAPPSGLGERAHVEWCGVSQASRRIGDSFSTVDSLIDSTAAGSSEEFTRQLK